MKLPHYILYILVAGVVFSCAPKIDPIFDDTSANRIEEEMETVQEILLSSPNGWLMEYYPSSTQSYGGFNVLLNFQPGNRVSVASETAGADKTAVSTYTLKQSAGCVLSFDTYNEILHFFSDPSSNEGMGNGYGLEGELFVLPLDIFQVVTPFQNGGHRSHSDVRTALFPFQSNDLRVGLQYGEFKVSFQSITVSHSFVAGWVGEEME